MNPLATLASTLSYELDALEPVLSKETVLYHLIQHHRDCYEQTAVLLRGTGLGNLSLEALVRVTSQQPTHRHLYAIASEAWNHDLYWQSLRPGGGGSPGGLIARGIRRRFGELAPFERRMITEASEVMGSGWLWITWKAGWIEVVATGPGDSLISRGHLPLLAIDLWEHAYYLDYRSSRAAYVAGCLRELINWDYANQRLVQLAANSDAIRKGLPWLSRGVAGYIDPESAPPNQNFGRSPNL